MSASVDITLGDVRELEEIVDREALLDVCRSFFDLFGIGIRVFSAGGALLADVHEEQAICAYVNTLSAGRLACGRTVSEVKACIPHRGTVVHPCFTGASYRIVPIEYQSRYVGRMVIGPFLPAETREVPPTLLSVDPGVDASEARAHLERMPRVRAQTADRIAAHLRGILDLLVFASHRAHLTSEMHVASVRESYRELAEKTSKLQQAYDRLKELDRLKSNFLATVSHELRTPLTSIIGYAEMLATGIAGPLGTEQADFVATIRGKGDHLLALITSMLDMNKLELGTLRLAREPVDPAGLLTEVVSTVAPQAQRKEITVHVETEPGLSAISGDPVRLRQIFLNLTDNALKFTPPRGRVTLGARAAELSDGDGGGLGMVLMSSTRVAIEFSVHDTGIGIPDHEQQRIFDAFYQVDGGSTREHGGAGLGLSIVKRLVDAHGGEVRIESALGAGTTFFVTLPRDASAPRS